MKPPQKMIIYNLFPLLAGPFSAWEEHLVRAAKLGFNWIFVNPLQLPGRSGSLYAVADYFKLNPLLVDSEGDRSSEAELSGVIRRAEELGLQVMIDLVINHCSVDSDLITRHPEWFLWERKGRLAHPSADENGKKVVWKDLARFDHRNTRDKEGLFQFFRHVVQHLIGLGFKGFRCDAAYQVPVSLWKRLIGEIKGQSPEVLFLAETLGCTTEQTRQTTSAGFDYIFNSSKWWDFRGHWLMNQYNLTRETAPSISFPESHDTVRLCEELNGNQAGLKQRYLFAALFSAGLMMPMGFEFGFRKRLHVVQTRPEDWEKTDIDLTPFIEKVNQIKASHRIFQEEAPTEISSDSNPQVLLMWKGSTTTEEESLLILNRDIQHRQPFHAASLQEYVQGRAPLADVSPEHRLDYIPTRFSYELLPGQGIVLVTRRDTVPED